VNWIIFQSHLLQLTSSQLCFCYPAECFPIRQFEWKFSFDFITFYTNSIYTSIQGWNLGFFIPPNENSMVGVSGVARILVEEGDWPSNPKILSVIKTWKLKFLKWWFSYLNPHPEEILTPNPPKCTSLSTRLFFFRLNKHIFSRWCTLSAFHFYFFYIELCNMRRAVKIFVSATRNRKKQRNSYTSKSHKTRRDEVLLNLFRKHKNLCSLPLYDFLYRSLFFGEKRVGIMKFWWFFLDIALKIWM